MPNVPIAGPRRARPPALPAAAASPVAAATTHAHPGPPPSPGSTRALPPLDYDDTTRGARPAQLEVTRPGLRRRRPSRVLWFVLGIAFGALVAVFAGGDTIGTLHAARAWGAGALRSLERKPPTPAPAAPVSVVTAGTTHSAIAPQNAPCPVDPGPDDPCAELLAPFTPNVPTVSIDDLPKVTPPPVAVVARRHARARPPAAAAGPAAPASEESAEAEPTPAGVNPDEEDPQVRPTRTAPASVPPVERPAPGAPASEQTTAKNEPT